MKIETSEVSGELLTIELSSSSLEGKRNFLIDPGSQVCVIRKSALSDKAIVETFEKKVLVKGFGGFTTIDQGVKLELFDNVETNCLIVKDDFEFLEEDGLLN